MDFFSRQERSRRATRGLLVMFLLSVAVIVSAVTLAAALFIRLYVDPYGWTALGTGQPWSEWALEHAGLLGLVAVGTLAFILLASLYRTASLSGGGGQVARMLGATEVTADTSDPLRRRLMNVVEEMAIASGLPVPEVYVLEQEQAINAFAAGLSPSDAAIAVTRGALERLGRAELQGVIAHEFSHVLNGDTRLNQRLMGLAFGILVLSVIGRWLLRSARFARRGRNTGGAAAAVALGAALTIIGWIGVFFSRLIKAAVSRQREALADASAVQFTRDPSGLAGALKKIGGYTASLSSVDSEEIAHMLFERGSRAFAGWFATHPPLIERIRALDPAFTPPAYPSAQGPVPSPASEPESMAPGLAGLAPRSPAQHLLEHAGEQAPPELASALRASVPEEIYHAARGRDSSMLLICALALDAGARIRERQLQLIDSQLGGQRGQRCRRVREELDALDPRLRLPVVELAVPALRQRPPEQLQYLLDLVERLGALGGAERLSDYLLLRLLVAYLGDAPHAPIKPRRARMSALEALARLLANVAAFGHGDGAAARAAFQAGLAALGDERASRRAARYQAVVPARDLAGLDAALARLATLRPRAKRRVLSAVQATITHDRRIEIEELELFRTIGATLGCPLPPPGGSAACISHR